MRIFLAVFLIEAILFAQSIPMGSTGTTVNVCGSPVSGMLFWLSGDCITFSGGVCSVPSNGSTISAWNDRSGNADNATSASGTFTFNTNQVNGLPAVKTTSASRMNLAGPQSMSDCHTLFAVFNATNGSGAMGLVGANSGAGIAIYLTASGSSAGVAYDVALTNFGGSTNAGQVTINTATWYQMNFKQSGPSGSSCNGGVSQFVIRVSRATIPSTNMGFNVNGPTQIFTYSGSTDPWIGSISELIYYSNTLSSSDVTTNETYLHCRYGL